MTDINMTMGGIRAAKWVGTPTEAVPIIRKSLNIKNPKNTYIDVCGLGFFELYVNGKMAEIAHSDWYLSTTNESACTDAKRRSGRRNFRKRTVTVLP